MTPSADPHPVLIAGGGIGGMSLALTLHQIGVPCVVLEAVADPQPLGVGINLQPNAVRELYDLGIGSEMLDAIGIQAREWALVGRNGNDVYAEPRGLLAGYRWPQYSVHRGKLQMLLYRAVLERLGSAAVRLGQRVTGYRNRDGGVTALIESRDGRRLECDGRLLVAADGLHSAVRAQMYPDQQPIQWGGAIMWRGTTPQGRSSLATPTSNEATARAQLVDARLAHAASRGRATRRRQTMETTMHHRSSFGALALVAMCGTTTALAESRQEQAARAVKQYDAPSAACALLTKDEVAKLTGRRAYSEPSGTRLVNDGSACDYSSANLTLFSGPKSDESYDKLVKNFKKDNSARQPVAGVGDSAYLWFPKARDQYEGNYAVLVVHQGAHTLALALEAQGNEAPPSLQPKLVAMAKTALPRLAK